MRPLRLTHVLPFGPPATQFGGPVAQLDRIAPALAARGHDVRLVCTDLGIDPDTPRDTWLERNGYHIHYGRTAAPHRVAPYWTPTLARALEEAIGSSDLVHLHLGLTLTNVLATRIARRHRVPYIYAPRGSLAPQRLQARRLGKWLFLRLFERPLIRDATRLHALTQQECADLTAQGGDRARMCVVPNAVDMGDPATWPTVGACRERLAVPTAAVAVLFLGQLHPVKGLDLLIDAAAAVGAGHRELMLLIAGPDKGYEAQARRRVRKHALETRVRFLGHLDDQAKLTALRAADIFALTSYAEGLPNAVLEACHLGLPVLISDRCHVPEVAAHDAGRVVPPQREAVTEALAALLESPERRRRMGRNARQLAEQRFSVARVVDQLETMYDAALGEARGDRVHEAPHAPHEPCDP